MPYQMRETKPGSGRADLICIAIQPGEAMLPGKESR